MSGIVGIYYPDKQPVKPKKLQTMLDTLSHRGSDGADIWCQDHVGFGHRMLWTTPESLLEKLPSANQAGNLIITADARIDNRDELISTLKLNICPTEKITDSQLILAAYEEWGESCPSKLIGDFAFAIWDQRQKKLFCARDHFGIKPFYYYYSSKVFVFASEIKALLCLSEVPRRLNELMVAYYLEMFFEDHNITFYKDIFRLPAANSLTISSEQKIQSKSYWSLNPKREIRLSSQEKYTEAFHEIFVEAVNSRLRSAFPVGSTLSGGLDSSSIACTARNLMTQSGNQKLHTFSAIFPSLPQKYLHQIDERKYIDAVKALGGFISHDVRADKLSPLRDLFWQDEEAIFTINTYMHCGLYDCANQQGVRVFLDGLDGDTTVGHGWSYLTELLCRGNLWTFVRELNNSAQRCGLSRRRILRQYAWNPLIEKPINEFWQWLMDSIIGAKPERDLISKSFAKQVGLTERKQKLRNNFPKLPLTVREEQWLSLSSGLYAYVLNTLDTITAKYSLEARYPFFDLRLVEFCLALPPEQKLRQGLPRAILRSAMKDILPPEVRWRVSKGNLFPNFKQQLLANEQEILEKSISQPKAIESYVDISALRNAYESYSSQPQQQGEDSISVLAAVILELWLNQSGLTP